MHGSYKQPYKMIKSHLNQIVEHWSKSKKTVEVIFFIMTIKIFGREIRINSLANFNSL